MRTRFTILVVFAMILTVVPMASVAAEPLLNPFVGSWEAFDSLGDDTSHNRLHISASGGWLIRDEAATACLVEGYGFVPVMIRGSGEFGFDSEPRYGDGPRFYTDHGAPAYCQPRNLLDRTFSPDFWYDSESDTLFGVGVCWWRAGVGDPSDCPG